MIVGGSHFAGRSECTNLDTSHTFDGYFIALHDDGSPATSIYYQVTGPDLDVSGRTDDFGRTLLISTGSSSKRLTCTFMLESIEITEQSNY